VLKLSDFFRDKQVLVTGGTGFIGSNLVDFLSKLGAKVRVTSRNRKKQMWDREPEVIYGDLKNYDFCEKAVAGMDYVFHLAAEGFTAIANPENSAKSFTPNILINSNIFSACKNSNVSHLLFASSLNVYDSDLNILSDEQPWLSHPHHSQKFFAWTKRIAEMQAQTYHDLNEFKVSIVRIGAVYGPKDNFNLENARVVPSLIAKVNNTNNDLIVWGSGKAERSFVFIDDAVDAITRCMEKYSEADPVNIGSGRFTSIKELVDLIVKISKSSHIPKFDISKPEGILKTIITIDKAKSKLGWESQTSLAEGLKKTIEWYQKFELKED
jgi:GDP-L-fucose synthase